MTKKNPEIITFGCRLNIYESEVIRSLTENIDLENTVIFNTCAVTKEAERQARQSIRRMHRERPDANIIVTGCSAQIHPETYLEIEGVSQVMGNETKMQVESYTSKDRLQITNIMEATETASHLISGFDGKTRAFVQVQNGCDHRCTFCIIPFGRGNSRSAPIGEIVNQVRSLLENDYKEIVLTGVDITSYGHDLPGKPSLGQMIRRLLAQVPELKRLRLSSLDPVEVDDDLYKLIAEDERLLPHLHISLQAGDDMVLKRMKRRHLREDVVSFCKKIRDLRPDMVFGADIIAGFPTETDEMFENTYNLIDETDLTFLHVFPYSERDGTPAAKMPTVDKKIRKARATKLREKGKERMHALFASKIGTIESVLVESHNKGHTDHFIPIEILSENGHEEIGNIVNVRIEKASENALIGEII